jgi:hypothetical protein
MLIALLSFSVNVLQEYASSPTEKWKSKDAAIYLVTSLAAKAQTQKVRLACNGVIWENNKCCVAIIAHSKVIMIRSLSIC